MKLNKKETENLLFTHLSNFVKNNHIPNGNTPEQIKELFQKVALDFAQNNDVLNESFESKISKYRKNLSIPMINYCVDETIQTFDLSREYGQPYYSNHTDEVPLCINPGSLERWESKKSKKTTSQSKKKTKIKVL